ncbi:MAG: glycosyltransferase family A protein [Hyphomonadaceae bacterium]|nr:glycosyltransferase family A protein [Hyphomonadaceae bacterium]
MTTELRFAVVTPVYNGAGFLNAAMEAVQAQTYRPLIHIVLDNCSTDGTADIIARFRDRSVPIVAHRNPQTLPAAANWSEAVRLVPNDVDYFKILCADDSMAPDAIEKLARAASSADDVRIIGAQELWNNVLRPTNLPASTTVFEASNFMARILSDSAQPAYHHLAYRTDLRGPGPFYPSDVVAFDAEAGFAALAQGGRVAWVHEPLFKTIDHAASLTSTWTKKSMSQHWEHFARLQRYGPGALSATEYSRVEREQLARIYRRIALRSVTGHRDVAQRDLELLRSRGFEPSLWDYASSMLSWAGQRFQPKLNANGIPDWPPTALKISRPDAA